MIHIGAIRKIFRGWRILICAWVDDNSPLKSQFFMLFRGDNGKEYIRIGKGYDPKTDTGMSGNAIGRNPLCGSASVNSWTAGICNNQ